jgi:membrane protein required for beta-lactamase induction
MNLIALLIGIFLEYTATRIFHLRAPRTTQKYVKYWFAAIKQNRYLNILVVVAMIGLCLIPVIFIDRWLAVHDYNLLRLVFAVIVLFFSFGPHDLVTDVEEYQRALQHADDSAEKELHLIEAAMPLTELRQHSRLEACSRVVTEGILAQGNKRFFAVIFWFLILGPVGAALFRITNSIRRESYRFSQTERDTQAAAMELNTIMRQWQGLLGWVPARLTALSYVLAGHFDTAMHALRNVVNSEDDDLYATNLNVMTQTGTASLQSPDSEAMSDPEIAQECTADALRLVKRSLILWVVIIAILTLWGSLH